jgi:DNA-binding MarR family transcriptional regulator
MKPEDRLMNLLQRMSSISIMKPPAESPLSMTQAMMLNWVSRTPGCGVLDIANGLHVTPPTVSVGVRRLVRDGWLEQRIDPEDRRSRPIYLTVKGNDFVAAMKQHRAKMLKLFLSGLDDDEKEQLLCLLDRAIHALENAQIQKAA